MPARQLPNDIPLVHVNVGLLADQVGKATANTLDLGQGVHDLVLTIDVGVEDTQNVLKLLFINHESLDRFKDKTFARVRNTHGKDERGGASL